MNVICGLDVHKRKIVSSIIELSVGNGPIRARVSYTSFFERTLDGMDKLCEFLKERNIKTVIMESTGPYSTTVYYFLESQGFDVWMAHPRDNKPRSQKKTDVSDAERLARGFVSGSIRTYKLPLDPKIRKLRMLTRTRKKLVEKRVSMKNMIIRTFDEACIDIKDVFKSVGKGALVFIDGLVRGMSLDEIIRRWPRLAGKREKLEKITSERLSTESLAVLGSLLKIIETLNGEIEKIDRMIENILAELGEDTQLLLTIPGVGMHASAILLAEIGNIGRFSSPKKLASYAGLVPSVYQSGDKVVYGGLRKDCNRRLRWIFYEIALSAIRLSPRLRAFYDRLIERGKAKKQALIAVARKIAVGVWHILTRKVRWNERIEKRLFRPRKRRVSKFTVREAIALLRNAGYIVIKSGSSI